MTAFRMEHAEQCPVGMGHPKIGVERKHAGRDALKNSFHLPAPLVEFRVSDGQIPRRTLELASAGLQFFGHSVEGADKISDFIGSPDVDAIIEATAGDFLRG